MAPLFFLHITIQKYFCWVCNWHHWIGFILLNISICILYFSELYLFFYEFWKFAVILDLYLNRGTNHFAAKCTRQLHPEPLATGPRSQRDPTGQVCTRERARALCPVTPAKIAGDVVRSRVRGRTRSTQSFIANHKQAAPLLLGHRRRRQRQWRMAVVYRKTRRRLPRTVTTIRSLIEREKGSHGTASSPRRRRSGRRGRRGLEAAGIEEEGRAV